MAFMVFQASDLASSIRSDKALNGGMNSSIGNLASIDRAHTQDVTSGLKISDRISHSRKPTIPDSNADWPLYTEKNQEYVNLAPNNFTRSSDGPKKDKCELWRPYLIRK